MKTTKLAALVAPTHDTLPHDPKLHLNFGCVSGSKPIRKAGAPVSVTLIKPASIDTPFPIHAKNYLDQKPTLPPPAYEPEDVAAEILHAAEHGGRDSYVKCGGKLLSTINKRIGIAMDWMASGMAALQSSGGPDRPCEGSLDAAAIDGQVDGNPTTPVHGSLYTKAQLHPFAAVALAALVGFAALAMSPSAKRS